MRTKFSGILTLLLAFVVQLTFAQEKTISGAVTDNTGLPLPGVNIIVKGTSNGTQSDFDGNYTLQASVGQTVVFSYVGFKSTEQAVNASTNTMNVQMEEDAAQLEEVVVTAFGIKKEKKALGYAVSSVKEEQIKDNPEADLTRVLQGKSAGVDITTQNGLSGSSNKVIIRGMNSFSGDNNALYVIDGVPYSNDTNEAGSFLDGNMGTSRSFDIDPSNIENIDILKGLAATTLYGTEGRNGVILITTKTGSSKSLKSKQEVQISTSYFFNKVASLPDYQNSFGGGFNQADADGWFYSNWGPGFYKDGLGGWASFINDDDDAAGFNSDGTLAHPYDTSPWLSERPQYAEFQSQFEDQRYEWRPRNSVENFFKTGGTSNASLNIRGRSEDNKYTYGLSFAHLNDKGFTPGNKVIRNNLTVAGSAKLTNKINVRGSLNFSRTNVKTPPIATSFGSSTVGSGSSIFGDLFYTPRGIDFYSLPYQLPDGGSIYYRQDNAIQHPLWTVNNARFEQLANRINGFGAIDYNITDHINISYQGSIDTYSEDNVNRQNRGGVTTNVIIDSGFYSTINNSNTITDHKIVLSGNNYSLFNDNLNIGFLLGATSRSTDFNSSGAYSHGQLVYGFFDHSNFTNTSTQIDLDDTNPGFEVDTEFHQRRNILGAYGQLNLDFNNIFFLNVSGRNDWVSNANNNTLFYPSASASFLPTAAFPSIKSDNGLNYLKLRAGYGTSANFSTGYPTVTTVTLNSQAWTDSSGTTISSNTTNEVVGNPDIKPELFSEIEFGAEGKLFQRLNFDLSYYTRTSKDLIVNPRFIPPSSGASETASNIGEVESSGFEAQIGLDIFKNPEGFNWNFGVNYSSQESEVTKLSADSRLIIYAGFTNLGNGARVGYPLGTLFGARIARDDDGNLLVDGVGNYISETADEDDLLPAIGDPNPDFVMNYTNTFSYRGLSLGIGINHTSGGDIYSVTVASLMGRGLTTDTEDRLGTYILPGVSAETGLPNDIQINNSNFYFDNGFASPADELSVYDGSVIRLREVSLGYTIPAKFLEKTPFGKIVIKASGYNLWYDAYNTPDGINFDPNVSGLGAGNGQGFDYLTGPSSKRYGVSINATF